MSTACAPAPEPEVTTNDFEPAMLGRWDVTVGGDDGYPMWFEVRETDGAVTGRMQPRTGHALEVENLLISGNHLMFDVSGTTYHANFDNGAFSGSLEPSEGSARDWAAVRAPELPAPENPEWGEPIELFNRADLTGWAPRRSDQPNNWSAEDGVLVNAESGSDLMTEEKFRDFRLQLEVNVPEGSNSGIYLRGRYEIQVQDDHGKEPHSQHMGGVYGQITPTSNTARPADEWQSFDITLLGRWVTVVLNGETIIDHQEIPGITGGALDSNEGEPGPILFQGDHGRILYRNVVLTPAVN
jgi:hypothetical protein